MKNKEIEVALILIEMSLTSSVSNEHYEANRKFALKQLEKIKKYIDEQPGA